MSSIRTCPEDTQKALNLEGQCNLWLQNYEEANQCFKEAIQASKDKGIKPHPRFYVNQAVALYSLEKKNLDRAEVVVAYRNAMLMNEERLVQDLLEPICNSADFKVCFF